MAKEKTGVAVVASNRKAGHDYLLQERFEAGLVLIGSEIKSIRDHRVNIADGYVEERGGELWLLNIHIDEYKQANRFGHEPKRARKLLLHRKQITQLIGQMREKGLSIIPTQLYLKGGRAKVEIAVAKGKKLFDKRDAIADRDAKLSIQRMMKEKRYED